MTYRDPFIAIDALMLKAKIGAQFIELRDKTEAAFDKIAEESAERAKAAYISIYGVAP